MRRNWLLTLALFCSGCLMLTVTVGCAGVMHVTNNFPPGRNEAGLGLRATNDVYMYSDTGDTNKQEASSFMLGGSVSKPSEPVTMPDEPSSPPDVAGAKKREPTKSPGATPPATPHP